MMSNFAFLKNGWPQMFEAAAHTEEAVNTDPRTACFYARRGLELAVRWIFKHDPGLSLPYQDNLSALIHEPTFKNAAGNAIFTKARLITQLGNQAVHSYSPVKQSDALTSVKELFHVGYWLARTYAEPGAVSAGIVFDPLIIPKEAPIPKQTVDKLQQLEKELHDKDENLSILLADKDRLNEELKRLRDEIAKARKEAEARLDDHDYSEAETRDFFIDLLLKEAGWRLDNPQDREFEVSGMPNAQGKGFVDYVLWGDDGKPLALVEAKRTRRDARAGQQQAKLYADCLEKQFNQRPVIFYSNGYEHWIWDDLTYPPRQIQGFYKKDELELLVQRRISFKPLSKAQINEAIVERYYQTRAIRRIAEAFEKDHDRKALVVMATGAGKTRTVIALCDLLMRCNRVKRVLFLADRVALVRQAVNAFKRHLPDSSPVNLVTEKDTEGRVFVSTYPTMMGLIDDSKDGLKRFGSGHFDLVIIDEAHRSVFQKYRAIFEYFDSLLVGLTATPKDEVDRNTYRLFDLENGVPTDAYTLEEAVRDGFLVPPVAVSVPLKFQREGIKYDELTEEDKDQWDALDWDEDGSVPDNVDPQSVNKWLFNKDTVDKVLEHLMTKGIKVAGGDRLGKTVIFAKNQAHADFIADRFNVNYPNYKGEFARVITFKIEYAQSLIDSFSGKDKPPHIAVSVDMLDTGIDVPEIVNLVFFKLVRSKTKFWQMIGRGTRLCPDLFGPGLDKKKFFIFDYCQNLEYFSQNLEMTEGAIGEPLGKSIFKTRLEMIGEADKIIKNNKGGPKVNEPEPAYGMALNLSQVRRDIAGLLHMEVSSMSIDNFIVRPKRRFVDKYSKPQAWEKITADDLNELAMEVAGLPSQLDPESEESKRFDLLILNLQLAVLRMEPAFKRLKNQVIEIAGLLEEKSAIPMVNEQMALIQEIQTDEWWQDVTVPMLEVVRKRLRVLVNFIEKRKRKLIYTDFEDEIGDEANIDLPGFSTVESKDFEKFRLKARAFLRDHLNHIAINKLRMNKPLTILDINELEKILRENGIGSDEEIEQAKRESKGLGLFVRSLVGLDREAAKEALAGFLSGKILTANQIEFINLIVNHLTDNGIMEARLLYESPFTDITSLGPERLFSAEHVIELIGILEEVRERAVA